MKWTRRLLVALCLFWAVRGLGVAGTVLAQLDLYQQVQAAGAWQFRVLVNGLCGLAFLIVAVGLWRQDRRAYRALMPLVLFYTVFSFIWFASHAQATYDQGRIPSVGVTSGITVGLAYWLQYRLRKLFNGERNDHY